MKQMTIKERILSAYRNELPDQIPVTIYDRYLPRGSVERELRDLGIGIVKYHPVVSMIAPPWHMGSGYLSEVKNTNMTVKYYWDNGTPVQRFTFETPVGTVFREISPDPAGAGSEHIRKHYITDIEDYKIIQYLVEHSVIKPRGKQGYLLKEELGDDGVIFGRLDRSPYQKCLIELAGAEQFLIDMFTDPEPVSELLETLAHKMLSSLDMIADTTPDIFWQPDNITVDMTPPNSYETYCMPLYEKYKSRLSDTGIPYMVHMDGRIRGLADLIEKSSFDIIESISYPCIGGDCTLTEARELLPSKVVIPNFPTNICYNTEDEIRDYTIALIEEAGKETPFVISLSEDIPPSQWKMLLPIVCKAVSEHGRY